MVLFYFSQVGLVLLFKSFYSDSAVSIVLVFERLWLKKFHLLNLANKFKKLNQLSFAKSRISSSRVTVSITFCHLSTEMSGTITTLNQIASIGQNTA